MRPPNRHDPFYEKTMEEPDFEALLDYLKNIRGFDFTGYKRPSLKRLTTKRMERIGVNSYNEYLDYLQVYPHELNHLFDALLLNVTTFFRDVPAWEIIQKDIIPRLLASKPNNELIRIWSAGCATGEEAYTIAIILAEVLGIEALRQRVKIYATDLDEAALAQGRLAIYSAKDLQNIPEQLRGKYFEPAGNNYTFSTDLRRCVIFGQHDLTQDAPISRLDILLCRNTLMYFNSETQARILARFHFALNDNGFLFVGKAEMLLSHTNLFNPVNLKYRIFSKLARISLRDRLLIIAEAGKTEVSNNLFGNMRLHDESFESLPIAQILVDIKGNITLVNREARVMFGINFQDMGRPFQDMEVS